jgi:hypothetical protein
MPDLETCPPRESNVADVGSLVQVLYLHRPCRHRRHVRGFMVLFPQGRESSVSAACSRDFKRLLS